MMVPIGIVTRDRPLLLDATLRSLSATDLPPDVSLTVFDDASDSKEAKQYLYTGRVLSAHKAWPNSKTWRELGLYVLNQHHVSPRGIQGLVRVVTLAGRSGVVNASCAAICQLFEAHPEAPGIFLLQDDVVFNANWYSRMLAASQVLLDGKTIGLLAGIRLNRPLRQPPSEATVISAGATAQCLYLSREAYLALRDGWLSVRHKQQQKFDDHLNHAVKRAGLGVGLIFPFVCQHIGMVSLVRPSRTWNSMGGRRGRVGYYSQPPYVLADAVRKFP